MALPVSSWPGWPSSTRSRSSSTGARAARFGVELPRRTAEEAAAIRTRWERQLPDVFGSVTNPFLHAWPVTPMERIFDTRDDMEVNALIAGGGTGGHLMPALAIAGSLAGKKVSPPGPGTFPTDGPLFTMLLVGVVVIVGALTFFPALSLGPVVEHFLARGGKVF